jgi:hypothetical protein
VVLSFGVTFPGAADIYIEKEIKALVEHILATLNSTRQPLTLFMDETTKIGKVVLQNCMALDLLTASQGRTYALLHIKCCVSIPDTQEDVAKALKEVDKETIQIDALLSDPLQKW